MMRNCRVTVRASDGISTEAQGTARRVLDALHILYEEKDGADPSAAAERTHLVIGDAFFEVRSSGAVHSVMHFEEGVSREVLYQTPFGTLPMNLETIRLRISHAPDEYRVEAEYLLLAGGEDPLPRSVSITVQLSS